MIFPKKEEAAPLPPKELPAMTASPIRVLLVEDSPSDAELLKYHLQSVSFESFEITHVEWLRDALDRLRIEPFDLVLLDLTLPDSTGAQTFLSVQQEAARVPIVVLTGSHDEMQGIEAVRHGVQDYLIKGQFQEQQIARAIRYAMERSRAQLALKRAHDELEMRVMERTQDLAKANDLLEFERGRLFSILDQLPSFVCILTPDRSIRFGNRCFRQLFGEFEGRTCSDVICLSESRCDLCPTFDVLKKKGQVEWEFISPAGRAYQIFDYPFTESTGALFVLKMGIDITERKRAEEALKESEDQLRRLSAQILSAQEAERSRISKELHDELGQALTLIKLRIGSISRKLRKDQAQLHDLCNLNLSYIDEVIKNVRRMSRDLSPMILEDLGLTTALRRLANDFADASGVKLKMDIADVDHLFLPAYNIEFYRIVQETLTNISKHSEANNVSLAVQLQDGQVRFSIEDDGKGMEVKPAKVKEGCHTGLGLVTIRERVRMFGGKLELDSGKGRGTRVSFFIPVEKDIRTVPVSK
jgi:two-component system, NarL family, sensor histidine kinase UhpB